jgi:hypothetical protein
VLFAPRGITTTTKTLDYLYHFLQSLQLYLNSPCVIKQGHPHIHTAAQPYLEFFNPDLSIQDEVPDRFHLFPQLTTELRLEVWRHAILRERIINVYLQAGGYQMVKGATKWVWGDIYSTKEKQPYGVFVDGFQLMNKFLRVCQESRHEVLNFYRVHIPCRLTTQRLVSGQIMDPDETKLGILHFNPEYDFLHINSFLAPLARPDIFLVDFLYRLKTAYDPRHIGLLNLALDPIDYSRLSGDGFSYKPTVLPVPVLETIQQLREVFFMCKQHFGRVNIAQSYSGTGSTGCVLYPLLPNYASDTDFRAFGSRSTSHFSRIEEIEY